MKKIEIITYCMIGMLIIGFIPTISGDEIDKANVTLIDEGFESGIPTEWINAGWVLDWGGFPHSGEHWVATSAAGYGMETNTQNFGENTELRFWYAVEDSGNPMSMEVWVDTTVVWSDIDFSHSTYQEAVVDLSSYTGDHTITFMPTSSSLYMELLDDILLTTEKDIDPPVITNVDATPPIQTVGLSVTISCNVNDDVAVDEVYTNITYPDLTDGSYLMSGSNPYSFTQTYSQAGIHNYHIYAVDTSGNGAESSTYTFEMNLPPTAGYSYVPSNPTTADTVSFTDLSFDSDGTVVSWNWDFDDSGSSTSQNPTHVFDDGTYTVTLTVTDDDGGVDSFFDVVVVSNILPDADFSFTPVSPSTADLVSFALSISSPEIVGIKPIINIPIIQ